MGLHYTLKPHARQAAAAPREREMLMMLLTI